MKLRWLLEAMLVGTLFSVPPWAFSQQEHVKLDWKPFENRLGIPAMWTPAISPEVHNDRTVTFRLVALVAKEVFLSGPVTTPLGKTREKLPMKKGADGIWSITIGPLPPDMYLYAFEMDGVHLADPNNTFGILSNQPPYSEVVVHGNGPRYYDFQEVLHGEVTRHIYHSKVVGGPRDLYVYTPPCYGSQEPKLCPPHVLEKMPKRFPVLYLLGGSGEIAGTWFEVGRLQAIMDNLLAEEKIRPMLIVCLNNQMTHRGLPKTDADWDAHSEMVQKDLLNHVIPLIESRYTVVEAPEGRALAGLSMGGRHTQYVGFRNLDTVGSLGILSAGDERGLERDAEILSDPDINGKIDYLFVGQGRLERAERTIAFLKALDHLGVEYEYAAEGGQAHDFATWRWLLYEHFLPGLFKE